MKCKVESRLQLYSSPSDVVNSDSTNEDMEATNEDMEVETELFIGRPGTRRRVQSMTSD